jgi:hypothetical protein
MRVARMVMLGLGVSLHLTPAQAIQSTDSLLLAKKRAPSASSKLETAKPRTEVSETSKLRSTAAAAGIRACPKSPKPGKQLRERLQGEVGQKLESERRERFPPRRGDETVRKDGKQNRPGPQDKSEPDGDRACTPGIGLHEDR